MKRTLMVLVGGAIFLGGFSSSALSSSAQAPSGTYSINFHAITSGGNTLRGECFMITGSVGQVSPGYSSGGIYTLYSGYQFPVQPASNAGDEIFFNGFEGCGP